MSNWVANERLTEENYQHVLWVGELPEIDCDRLLGLYAELSSAVSKKLIPETAIFYNLARAYVVPAGDKETLAHINCYHETHNHNGGTPIVESDKVHKPRYYIPGQINLTCFLREETIQGGAAVVAERLEDVLIGCLLDYDVYGEHALNMDGGGAGVLSRRGKRFCTLHVSESSEGVYVAETMLNIDRKSVV